VLHAGRLDTLFARLLLAQGLTVVCATITFGALVFFDRNVVLAGPYAEVLAPELARVIGTAPMIASPQSVERIAPPDPHGALSIETWPGAERLIQELDRQGFKVDQVNLHASPGRPTFSMRVRTDQSPPVWIGVTDPSIFPRWYPAGIGLLAALAVVTAASWAIARHVSRPLEWLEARIRSQSASPAPFAGERKRQPTDGTAEIRSIAAAYADLQARLERIERERKVMLGGISHDMRSPLARIRLAAEMLPVTVDTMEQVQTIVREVEHADRLVGSFLDFVVADELALDETVDLAALTRASAAEFGRLDLPPTVAGPARLEYGPANGLLLQRAIANLIDNAFKHGRAPVVVTLTNGSDGVAIQVDDHGDGMDPEAALRLTEAFARGDGARSVPGTGLGLAIVGQVVNRLGGQLSFERLESGQRVRVTLPAPR
jgi:two-component system, OmpR family, osmolarity sensor histidine kinase EnvZ